MSMKEKIKFALFNLLLDFKIFRLPGINLVDRFVSYQNASIKDADELSGLYQSTSGKSSNNLESSIRRLEKKKGSGYVLKACINERILGAVFLILVSEEELSPYSPGWWIFSLLVNRRYRRLGIGEDLLHTALQEAKGRGAKEVNLMVAESNKAATSLYRKMGFQENSNPKVDALMEDELKRGKSKRIFMTIQLDSDQ